MNKAPPPSSHQQSLFSIEDTADLCYRDVISALERRNWLPAPVGVTARSRKTKLDKKMAIVRTHQQPRFVWTISENAMDFDSLHSMQLAKHFKGISALTTKNGVCDMLREMSWIGRDHREVSPRAYNLGDPSQRSEFIEDFRLCAASNLLKFVARPSFPDNVYMANETLQKCFLAVARYLHFRSSGDCFRGASNSTGASRPPAQHCPQPPPHSRPGPSSTHCTTRRVQFASSLGPRERQQRGEGAEAREESFTDQDCCDKVSGLSEGDWEAILSASYRVAMSMRQPRLQVPYAAVLANRRSSPRQIRAALLLQALERQDPQFFMNGARNIWVIKAPEACRGTNIRLMNRMADILDCERKMGGRTVQKYVETPLLTNHFHLRPSEQACKFDLRVWVLVTSFQPLKARIYSRVYGRRCGQAYNYVASSIADTYTHLTNYSIQSKKAPFSLKPPVEDEDKDEWGDQDSKGQLRARKPKEGQGEVGNDALPSDTAAKLTMFQTILQEERGLRAGGGAAGKLRSKIQSQRARPLSAGATSRPSKSSLQAPSGRTPPSSNTTSELLLTFDELIAEQAEADVNHNGRALWEGRVWPGIKRKVSSLLLMSAQHVQHRENSFEFLGFDVLIDEQCEPWILEVNMSPALAHRDPVHNELIKSMAEQMIELLLKEDAEMDDQTVTGVTRVGDWQEIVIEGSSTGSESARGEAEIIADHVTSGPGKRRLSKSLALALAQAEAEAAVTNPNSAANYEGSFGYVEPPKSTKEFVPSLDLAFSLQGTAITAAEMKFADRCNSCFAAALLLQRWARRYIPRTRLYHDRRLRAVLQLQQCVRASLARSQLTTLRRARASVHLQCAWRQRLARRRRALLLLSRAVEAVQRATRVRQACQRARRRHRLLVARRVLIWYRHRKRRWRRGSARRIQRCCRRWLRRRRNAIQKIGDATKLWYQRRDAASRVIGRPWRRCVVYRRWYSAWRRRRVSAMASEAADIGLEWAFRKQQTREEAVRKEEEAQQLARTLQEQAAREKMWKKEQETIQELHQAWLADLGLNTEESEASNQPHLEQRRDRSLAELMADFEESPRDEAGSSSQGGSEGVGQQLAQGASHPYGETLTSTQVAFEQIHESDTISDCKFGSDNEGSGLTPVYLEDRLEVVPGKPNPNITFLDHGTYHSDQDGFCRTVRSKPLEDAEAPRSHSTRVTTQACAPFAPTTSSAAAHRPRHSSKKKMLMESRKRIRKQWVEREGISKHSKWSREDMHAYICERQAFLAAAYESSQLQDFFPEPPPDSSRDPLVHTAVCTATATTQRRGNEPPRWSDDIDLNSFLASAPSHTPPPSDSDSLYDQQLAQFMRKLELRKEAKAKQQHRRNMKKKNHPSPQAPVVMLSCENSRPFPREGHPVSSSGTTRFDFDSEGKSDYERSAGLGREGWELLEADPLSKFEPHFSHHNKQAADRKEEQRLRVQELRHRHSSTDREKVRRGVDTSWDAAWHADEQSQHAPLVEYGQDLSNYVDTGRAHERMRLYQEPRVERREESHTRAMRSMRQRHGERKQSRETAGGDSVGADRRRTSRPKSASASSSRHPQKKASRAPPHHLGLW